MQDERGTGIGFGFLAYIVARTAQGRWLDVHPFMWLAGALL
jgi:xanthine/uracil/vitamin C permease (AzgA family)